MRGPALLLAGVVTALVFGPLAVPFHYAAQDRDQIAAPPSAQHPLGTDSLGRDNLARFLIGGRLSLALAGAAALAACSIAAAVGTAAALGGRAAHVAGALWFDTMLSTPWYLLVFCLRAALPLDASPAMTAALTFALLGTAGWAQGARAIRDEVKQSAQSAWMLQSRSLGFGGATLLWGHITPFVQPLLWAQFLMLLPKLLLAESTLGMLGLGVPEPLPSWGGCLADLLQPGATERPWLFIPAIALGLIVISFRALAANGKQNTIPPGTEDITVR